MILRLQFDGSRFAGWQRQTKARTVQQAVEQVFERLCGRRVVAHAAGRTDAGVHALGMAVSATVPGRWTPEALHRALNALLPDDVWAESVAAARRGFHARKCATGRRYEYRIGTDAASRSPFRRPFEWPLGRALDGGRLDAAAGRLLGTHDFRALAVHTGGRVDCRCSVSLARWTPRSDGEGWRFAIAANRFLHHMVRILVGTMVDVGLDRRPSEDLGALLAGRAGMRASPPAPPEGLYFVRADYPPHWFEESEP